MGTTCPRCPPKPPTTSATCGSRVVGRVAAMLSSTRTPGSSLAAALVWRFVFLDAIQAFLSLRAQSLHLLSVCPYISYSYRLGQDEITLEVG